MYQIVLFCGKKLYVSTTATNLTSYPHPSSIFVEWSRSLVEWRKYLPRYSYTYLIHLNTVSYIKIIISPPN